MLQAWQLQEDPATRLPAHRHSFVRLRSATPASLQQQETEVTGIGGAQRTVLTQCRLRRGARGRRTCCMAYVGPERSAGKSVGPMGQVGVGLQTLYRTEQWAVPLVTCGILHRLCPA